jgi:hypothetical protein
VSYRERQRLTATSTPLTRSCRQPSTRSCPTSNAPSAPWPGPCQKKMILSKPEAGACGSAARAARSSWCRCRRPGDRPGHRHPGERAGPAQQPRYPEWTGTPPPGTSAGSPGTPASRSPARTLICSGTHGSRPCPTRARISAMSRLPPARPALAPRRVMTVPARTPAAAPATSSQPSWHQVPDQVLRNDQHPIAALPMSAPADARPWRRTEHDVSTSDEPGHPAGLYFKRCARSQKES